MFFYHCYFKHNILINIYFKILTLVEVWNLFDYYIEFMRIDFIVFLSKTQFLTSISLDLQHRLYLK